MFSNVWTRISISVSNKEVPTQNWFSFAKLYREMGPQSCKKDVSKSIFYEIRNDRYTKDNVDKLRLQRRIFVGSCSVSRYTY